MTAGRLHDQPLNLGNHSSVVFGDVRQQARLELAELLSDAKASDLLILVGSRLQAYLEEVAAMASDVTVLVIAKNPNEISVQDLVGEGARIKIVQGADQLAECLAAELVYGRTGRVAIFCPQEQRLECAELLAETRQVAQRVLERSRIDRRTRRRKSLEWLNNLSRNFARVLELPDLALPENVFEDRPALVVGAGPSLDESLEYLLELPRGVLVLAAASALGPLARRGLRPHLAVALEAKDESRQFAAADGKHTWLMAATTGHPNHFSGWPSGRKGLFHLLPWVAWLVGQGRPLPTGGHATSAAFSLAVLWGCNPIILVGQDLAFSGGRIHASGRPGGEDEDHPVVVSVPAIGGGEVPTSPVMESYLGWYQESAAFLARCDPGRRLVNATAQGALLAGFEHAPLHEVLAGLAAEKWPQVGPELERLCAGIPRPPRRMVAQRLALARNCVRDCLQWLSKGDLSRARQTAATCPPAQVLLAECAPEGDAMAAADILEQLLEALRRMGEGISA